MRYPLFLQKNGCIGVVAPSFGATTEPYITRTKYAAEIFKKAGYGVAFGPNVYAAEGHGKSNTPEKCAAEFMDYYLNPAYDILISAGGGETMCEDVSYVDWEKIAGGKPKWFMGYSDNTNFTYLLTTLCDTASVYGPCFAGFAAKNYDIPQRSAMRLVTGDNFNGNSITLSGYPLWEKEEGENPDFIHELNLTEEKKLVFGGTMSREARFKGRLLGGCVDCLQTLLGTKFDKTREFIKKYENDGIVWFLECCDLSPIGVRRAFWQMSEAGWFENAKGFIIGRPMHFGEEAFGLNMYDAVMGVLEKYRVPVIMDADLGHLPPCIPLVTGSMAEVTADSNIHIKMSYV